MIRKVPSAFSTAGPPFNPQALERQRNLQTVRNNAHPPAPCGGREHPM